MRICIYGPPASGKSSIASWIFSELKIKGVKIELVQEYVKFWTYIRRKPRPFDQVYFIAQQLHQEDNILAGGAEAIVTDCPLYLPVFYAYYQRLDIAVDILNIAMSFEKQHPAIHIFLEDFPSDYNDVGRFHTKEEAEEIGQLLYEHLQIWAGDRFYVFSAKQRNNILDMVYNLLYEKRTIEV